MSFKWSIQIPDSFVERSFHKCNLIPKENGDLSFFSIDCHFVDTKPMINITQLLRPGLQLNCLGQMNPLKL